MCRWCGRLLSGVFATFFWSYILIFFIIQKITNYTIIVIITLFYVNYVTTITIVSEGIPARCECERCVLLGHTNYYVTLEYKFSHFVTITNVLFGN